MRVLLMTADDDVVGRAMCDQFQVEQLEAELVDGVVIHNRRDQSSSTWRTSGPPAWEVDDDGQLGRRLTVEAVPDA